MFKRCSKAFSLFLILSIIFTVFIYSGDDSSAASSGKVKYIAHRGWSLKAPENSLASLRLAAKNPEFYGVEFDVWEAAYKSDENPLILVMHDKNIQRMCGVSKNIRSIKRSTLGKYRIKAGNNVEKYNNQKIPTSYQAFNAIYGNSKGAIPVIELKHRLSKPALKYLLKTLKGRKAVVISFDFNAVNDTVKLARKMGISKNIKTMYLSSDLKSSKYKAVIDKMKKAGIDSISLKYTIVSKETVNIFHSSGLKVAIWTLPDQETADTYIQMGVDFITSNGNVY